MKRTPYTFDHIMCRYPYEESFGVVTISYPALPSAPLEVVE